MEHGLQYERKLIKNKVKLDLQWLVKRQLCMLEAPDEMHWEEYEDPDWYTPFEEEEGEEEIEEEPEEDRRSSRYKSMLNKKDDDDEDGIL